MKQIFENIHRGEGLVLVYSQFVTVEGLGVFSILLEANGYSPFGKDDDLPKYAIYSGTEDEESSLDGDLIEELSEFN